jgi:diguanylate cyclase (GGDEF)-like protein
MNQPKLSGQDNAATVDAIFRKEHQRICRRTDRLIALIMCFQWPAAIAAAVWIAPHTWIGNTSSIHPHIWAAIYLGGIITVFPVLLAILRPGEKSTRHLIAVAQMLMSALLIHITGGRIETHFHVFGSLAFLAFYLDWPVLITASAVTLVDHAALGVFYPLSIFGTSIANNWRFLEHVLWVVFCIVFLARSCMLSLAGLREIAKRETEQERLITQAYHDTLTGLPNRLHLQKHMANLLQSDLPTPVEFAIMAIDLDRFKEVNDTLGHLVGDELLIQVGNRLKQETRPTDIVVRMGGDEFVLVLRECTSALLAEKIAERIVTSLNVPFICREHTISIGASVGICLYPHSGQDLVELLDHADLALYKVKNNGRNGFQLFDDGMRDETLLEMSLEHRLRRAIKDSEFEVYYQPLVSIAGTLLGFEALLRWNDPVYGLVQPNDFIAFAEKTGLIVPIGEWVLRQACAQAEQWRRSGQNLSKMSVNVSSVQMVHKDFVSVVLAVLRDTGLPPELLDLELTEHVVIENFEEMRQRMTSLRHIGVRLSIDDFGTGYSSLGYLRELPVHTIKIDRIFVNGIDESPEARSLVEGIIAMAHSLGLKVVAEGVETIKQLEILTQAGSDEIQGYYISRPVPLSDVGLILNAGRFNLPSESPTLRM